jgi:hypothetical protein
MFLSPTILFFHDLFPPLFLFIFSSVIPVERASPLFMYRKPAYGGYMDMHMHMGAQCELPAVLH